MRLYENRYVDHPALLPEADRSTGTGRAKLFDGRATWITLEVQGWRPKKYRFYLHL